MQRGLDDKNTTSGVDEGLIEAARERARAEHSTLNEQFRLWLAGLQERYHCSFHDSLIVAAALDAGCTRLYSEDLQDGQRIENLTIENPFKS